MTEKVVITLTEKELIQALSKQYDLQPEKTTITFTMKKPLNDDPFLVKNTSLDPNKSLIDFVIITSDRKKQSEVRTYNQMDH